MSEPDDPYLDSLRAGAEKAARRREWAERKLAASMNGLVSPVPEELSPVCPATLSGLPVPTRRWCVPGWIPDEAVTALYGDGGTGKTLIAQMLMTSASLGRDWLGLPTNRRRALGIFCEDSDEELWRRQADINAAYGCEFADLTDFNWMSRVGEDNLLVFFEHGDLAVLTAFFGQLLEYARIFKARLLVIDTAADTFGGNENIRPQVRQFVSMCLGRLAMEINGAVVLCAHPSVAGMKDGHGAGGSTAWNNSVRSRLYLKRDEEAEAEDPEVRILEKAKANYGSLGDRIRLRWRAGAFVADQPETGLLGAIHRRTAEQAFLECLAQLIDQGFAPTFKQAAGELFAPRLMAGRALASGFSLRDLETAMKRLMDDGRVVLLWTNERPSRRRQFIAPADHPKAKEKESEDAD